MRFFHNACMLCGHKGIPNQPARQRKSEPVVAATSQHHQVGRWPFSGEGLHAVFRVG